MPTKIKNASPTSVIDAELDAHEIATKNEQMQALRSDNDASSEWEQYSADRDELLATPFGYNRTMAQEGVPFTILRRSDRVFIDETTKEARNQYVYLVVLQAPYTWYNENDASDEVYFKEGEQVLICLDVNFVRERDAEKIDTLLAKYGEIPNCALQQYPTKKKGQSPSNGIVHAKKWRSLREMTAK